jgi:hypothetical protein
MNNGGEGGRKEGRKEQKQEERKKPKAQYMNDKRQCNMVTQDDCDYNSSRKIMKFTDTSEAQKRGKHRK